MKARGYLFSARRKNDFLAIDVLVVNRYGRGERIQEKPVLRVGDVEAQATKLLSVPRVAELSLASIKLPYEKLIKNDIHTEVYLLTPTKGSSSGKKPVLYSFANREGDTGRVRAVSILKKYKSTVYVRQSAKNTVYITNRQSLETDKLIERLKITLMYWVSRLTFFKKDTLLLYEKESSKYEESASVLFEKLVDNGYTNIRYVLLNPSKHTIGNKYRKYIVPKYSLRHYYYFFLADRFIGTELPQHALDIRVANKYVIQKATDEHLPFIFLQHGVMYMVSLASEARKGARKKSPGKPKNMKTVVSSKLEAEHFIEQGGYDLDDLYISGLPKFDRSIKYNNAAKIVIMPTWRPWEFTQMRVDPVKSPYYQMIEDMIDAVPGTLKHHITVLPHPLFHGQLLDTPIGQYMKSDRTYDEILRETNLLITDYSSIAYDAFYRGSNVIFWWKELEDCMQEYGGSLMLNDKNVFGDVSNNKKQLTTAIIKNYDKTQSKVYKQRFSKIVSFQDGHNTDRLLKMLIDDGVIKKQS